ncbi:hypothetical protein AYX14_07141 [Cryptococcus neoformans]|nr:hypothetical protein AYX14_07141 [Cryptococcus neoformans var. grubii]
MVRTSGVLEESLTVIALGNGTNNLGSQCRSKGDHRCENTIVWIGQGWVGGQASVRANVSRKMVG